MDRSARRSAASAVAALAVLATAASGCAAPGAARETAPDGAVEGRSVATGGLVLAADAWAAGDTLRARLRLTNVSAQAVRVGYGACSAWLLGWADAQRARPPDLTTVVRRSAEGYAYGCPLYLATTTIAPGETLAADEFRVAAPLAEVLGDTVRDGRYWLRAELRIVERDGRPAPDTLRADLGPLDLAVARPPLGAEAARLGARFRADSVRVEGGRLRAVVRAVPVPNLGPDVVGWAPCAVRVLAFAEARQRDAAPRVGPPAAHADAACGRPPPTPFEGSNADRDGPPFYVAPERAHRAAVDLPLADLLGGLPAGRYALAAAVRTVGPTGYDLRPLAPVYLSLGEVDWAP